VAGNSDAETGKGISVTIVLLLVVVAFAFVIGVLAWFLVPTVRALGSSDFEPTYRDDASAERAQQSGPESGLGAGGGGM
jgi:hypothetical protein